MERQLMRLYQGNQQSKVRVFSERKLQQQNKHEQQQQQIRQQQIINSFKQSVQQYLTHNYILPNSSFSKQQSPHDKKQNLTFNQTQLNRSSILSYQSTTNNKQKKYLKQREEYLCTINQLRLHIYKNNMLMLNQCSEEGSVNIDGLGLESGEVSAKKVEIDRRNHIQINKESNKKQIIGEKYQKYMCSNHIHDNNIHRNISYNNNINDNNQNNNKSHNSNINDNNINVNKSKNQQGLLASFGNNNIYNNNILIMNKDNKANQIFNINIKKPQTLPQCITKSNTKINIFECSNKNSLNNTQKSAQNNLNYLNMPQSNFKFTNSINIPYDDQKNSPYSKLSVKRQKNIINNNMNMNMNNMNNLSNSNMNNRSNNHRQDKSKQKPQFKLTYSKQTQQKSQLYKNQLQYSHNLNQFNEDQSILNTNNHNHDNRKYYQAYTQQKPHHNNPRKSSILPLQIFQHNQQLQAESILCLTNFKQFIRNQTEIQMILLSELDRLRHPLAKQIYKAFEGFIKEYKELILRVKERITIILMIIVIVIIIILLIVIVKILVIVSHIRLLVLWKSVSRQKLIYWNI